MGHKGAPRANEAEMEKRTSEILDLLLQGHTRSQIIKVCKGWKISPRGIDGYISAANIEIREINQAEREDNLARIKSNLWKLYRLAIGMDDRQEARTLLRDISAICGLEEKVVNLKGDLNHNHKRMDLEERIKQLKEKK